MSVPRYFALIPAAGIGERMGGDGPKQYVSLAGKPMLQHVLETFAGAPQIAHTFVVVSADDGYIAQVPLSQRTTVLRCGGDTR
eukprot:gene57483-76747_t